MVSSRLRHGRDLQPHPARWSKRHLKTRWGAGRDRYAAAQLLGSVVDAFLYQPTQWLWVPARASLGRDDDLYEIPITLPLLPSRKPMHRVAPHHQEKREGRSSGPADHYA